MRQDFEPVIQPTTVGGVLAVTRMKFGQDLRQVSQALRIRQGYLEAIEQDRHSDLPGLPYAVGFVRSYADYLGLDGKALVQRYKDEAQGLSRKPILVFPSPVQEGKVPTGAIILVSLILVGLAYAGWTYFSRETLPPPAAVAAPPTSSGNSLGAAPAPTPSAVDANASEAQPAPAPAAQPQPEAPLAGTGGGSAPAPGGSLGGPLAAPLPQPGATDMAAATPAPAAGVTPPPAVSDLAASGGGPAPIPAAPTAPAVAPAATQEAALPSAEPAARVVIRAKQDSWVQIRDAKDQAIVTQVLREGDSYPVPDQPGLVLLTGNAGGLVITVDGKTLPPLGAVGAVKRNLALDPDKLLGQ
jgi:cytoskeleton protein RodZ